jgi:hypothetical protein
MLLQLVIIKEEEQEQEQADNEWGQKRSLRRLHLSGEPTQIYTSTIQPKNTIIRPQSTRNMQFNIHNINQVKVEV